MSGFSDADISFMNRALELARKGVGRTRPNPVVGAVVVKDGTIVGEGWHMKAGTPHAEVHALNDAGNEASGATIYVTLEPCNHTGKTPPCTRAVLDAGISRVVIGALDPNPTVAGGGMAFLKSQGLDVSEGCLREECRLLIAPFARHIRTGRPWVKMKAACSMDGRTATHKGHSQWITNRVARLRGHDLRLESDAILVGRGTVEADNPSLTCRSKSAREDGSDDPLRIILDSTLSTDPGAAIYHLDSPSKTVVAAVKERVSAERVSAFERRGVDVMMLPGTESGRVDLHALVAELGERGVQSLLVEGGATVHGAFVDADLVDEVFFFYAPLIIGGEEAKPAVSGIGAETLGHALHLEAPKVEMLEANWMVTGVAEGRLEELFNA